MSSSKSPVRQVNTRFENGRFIAKSMLSPQGFPVRALIKVYPSRVIPIVFLPGVMGTNLRMKKNGAAVWRPPNGLWQGLVEATAYWSKDAITRKAMLKPDAVEVDGSGPVQVTSSVENQLIGGVDPKEVRDLMGWGELHQKSYSFILNALHNNLHNILDEHGVATEYWKSHVLSAHAAKHFGAQKPFAALKEEELRKFASAAYPVHAIGYNWLQSNNESVERVIQRLDAIIRFYRDRLGRTCDKVILVTHSMGGLVARALTRVRNSDKVLGVLHGVMPAIGAPATYKRMRAGFEGVEQVLLGRNAAESTAVLTQARGPLELLPTMEYMTQGSAGPRHWLEAHFQSQDVHVSSTSTLLGSGDPYKKIYANQIDWWRLVKSELINPTNEKKGRRAYGDQDFLGFKKNLDIVRTFHEAIAQKYHDNTYAFYAADPAQATWAEVRWRTSKPGRDFSSGQIVSDDLNGKVKVKFRDEIQEFEIAEPRGLGDGTVPEFSGRAPTAYVKQIFRHEGTAGGHTSYDHQFSYGSDFTAGLTLYSIARLVLDSNVLDGSENG